MGIILTPLVPTQDTSETLDLSHLTEVDTSGAGAFDVLMRGVKSHLDEQWKENRLRGPEYATVYLGMMQAAMSTASSFILAQQQSNLDAELKRKQLLLADRELVKAATEIEHIKAQTLEVNARKDLLVQQRANAAAESANIPKQGALIDAQRDVQVQQKFNLVAQENQSKAEKLFIEARTANAAKEGLVLDASKAKADSEKLLLDQKTATEKAQILSAGVDADSIMGRQKGLYLAQADGFKQDAVQKAVKILVDTWNVRRTTNDGTVADGTNKLGDAEIGAFVTKLAQGIGVNF